MKNIHVIEYVKECDSCKGTGLYVGLAERDGSAVVCHTCKGTGRCAMRIEYREFTGRQPRTDVEQVMYVNPGICIGLGNDHELTDFGGMPYEDWAEGKPWPIGSEDRQHTCPAQFYQQADSSKKPDMATYGCELGYFGFCHNFENKAECWRKWDAEQATTQEARHD